MNATRVVTRSTTVAILLAVLILAPRSQADGLNSGSISGSFSNFVLTGNIVDGGTRATSFMDNTATAIFSGSGTSDITWGGNFTPPPGTNNFSELSFTGASFSNVAPGQVFELGVLTYSNGSSALNTMIFGATFTMTANLSGGGTATITPFTSALGLVTTTNDGPTAASNADFVNFPSLGKSFNVLEGGSATAILFGEIVGDPALHLTDVQVAPGSTGTGFIASTPEPSTWLLLAAGLGLLTIISKRVPRGLRDF